MLKVEKTDRGTIKKVVDVIYCGNPWEEGSINSFEFQKQVLETFPNAIFREEQTPYRGTQVLVTLNDVEEHEYYAWIIAYGWFEISLNFRLIMMDKAQRELFDKSLALAQEKYPQFFKEKDKEVEKSGEVN